MWTAEDTKQADRVLERALAEDPADATAAAMLGVHRIAAGWRIRTDARARRVSRRRFARFHGKLHEAEQILAAGLGHAPDDPALWTASLATARGLELGLNETRRRYGQVAAIDPHHLPAQASMLQQLCPKWGGTWDRVHTFSHEAMRSAPPGAPNAVLHTGFRREPGWVQVMNTFAMAFSLLGAGDAAAMMFTALGPHATIYPWAYQGDGVAAFRRSRALAFGWSGPAVVDWLLAGTGTTARRGALALFGTAWR